MRRVDRIEQRGLRWELAPEFQQLMPRILDDTGQTVKQSPVTSVTRHQIGNRVFYRKRYHHENRLLWPTKFFFKAPRSRVEWKLAPRLQALGIPAVPHLAHGERWSWRGLLESSLITEQPAGYQPLTGGEELRSPSAQQALGRLVRRMHDAGLVHGDLSPKNLLVFPQTGALCLVDLDKIACRRALDLSERLANLALIGAQVQLTDAFYEAYGSEFQQHAARVAREAEAQREVLAARIARHWRQHTHEMAVHRGEALLWYVRRQYAGGGLDAVLANPDRFRDRTGGEFLVWRFGAGPARARCAFEKAYRRELLGIPGPRPVAVGEDRVCGICRRSYFVARA